MLIDSELYQVMVAHALRAFPEEACGLVGGKDGRAIRADEIENILHSPVAYEMDPLTQIKTMLEIEAQGLELMAIYHSHPAGPAFPSGTDIRQAYYPETIQIIISLEDQSRPQAAAFHIIDGRVASVTMKII